MKTRRLMLACAVLLLGVAGAFLWYPSAPGDAPSGAPVAVTVDATALDATAFEALRADFNRDASQARLILLLSPT